MITKSIITILLILLCQSKICKSIETPYSYQNFIHFDENNKTVHIFNCQLNEDLLNTLYKKSNQLQEIYLQHCNIPTLHNVAFMRFPQLITLELSDSHINQIQDFAFNELKFLKHLNLARNNLTQLKSWSYNELTSLISLDMRRNQIHELNPKNFTKFPNLQKLNLAVNFIKDIQPDTFRILNYHLKYLNLGKNQITKITAQTFRGLIKLTNLALHFNQIEFIDEMAFEKNTHLKILRLEGNKIVTLNFMHFSSLARLQHFNISHNNIKSLEQFSFITDFELKNLDISYNQIDEVSENTFDGLQSLEVLNASHNSIKELSPRTFNELTSLTHLDFSGNLIKNFDESILNSTLHLEYLNLSKNSLHELESSIFTKLKSLEVLDLSYNTFDHDNFLVKMEANLKTLNLAGNRYETLNMSVLYNIQYVNLEANPWNCQWLIREYVRTPGTVHFGANYTVEVGGSLSLDMPGIECYNGQMWKSLVVVNKIKIIDDYPNGPMPNAPVHRTIIYKLRLDRFDQKSVIIWMIFCIFLFFGAIKIARKILEKSERKKELLKQQKKAKNNDYEELPSHERIRERNENVSDRQTLEVPNNRNACQSEPCIPNCEHHIP